MSNGCSALLVIIHLPLMFVALARRLQQFSVTSYKFFTELFVFSSREMSAS